MKSRRIREGVAVICILHSIHTHNSETGIILTLKSLPKNEALRRSLVATQFYPKSYNLDGTSSMHINTYTYNMQCYVVKSQKRKL